MQPSGEAATGLSYIDPYWRYFATLQVLPWLEATFRYTAVEGVPYNEAYPDESYKDRSFDVKVRLLRESAHFPEVSIGLRDVGGTGLFSSEYIVASRRWWDFDFSLGVGWGNMANAGGLTNPLRHIDEGFATRGAPTEIGGLGTGYFGGAEIGLFGGVEWRTPVDGLRVKAEWDANDYERDIARDLERSLPVNLGMEYDVAEWFRFAAAFERGNAFMLKGTLRANFDELKRIEPHDPPPAIVPRPARTEPSAPAVPETALGMDPSRRTLTVIPDDRHARRVLAVDTLFDRMARYDIDPGTVILRGAEAVIALDTRRALPPDHALAEIAYGITGSRAFGEVQKVTFAVPGPGGPLVRRTFDGDALSRSVRYTGHAHALLEPPPPEWQNAARTLAEAPDLPTLLYARLEDAAIDPLMVSVTGRTLQVHLPPATPPPDDIVLRRLAQRLGETREPIDTVVFAIPTGDGTVQRLAYSAHADPVPPKPGRKPENSVPPALPRPPIQHSPEEIRVTAERVFADLVDQGLRGDSLNLQDRTAILRFINKRYRQPALAFGRAARVLATHAPRAIERLRLVLVEDDMPVTELAVLRSDLEELAKHRGSPEEIWQNATLGLAEPDRSQGTVVNTALWPRFGWGFQPFLRHHVGGGDEFFAWQLWASLNGRIDIAPGLAIAGSIGQDIANTFDRLNDAPVSALPHVRSEIVRYLQNSDTWLNELYGEYVAKLTPRLYARFTGGILEEMYSGVSGEILYRPADTFWALGLELNRVIRRDYDRLFGHLDYTVNTGHLSLYTKLPYAGLFANVHMGQYLAGDRGATLEIGREFANGVKIMAFATKTDVSAEEFGEGSFDKGFSIRVPFDAVTGRPNRFSFGTTFRPLTRDGGQRVNVPGRLYNRLEGGYPDRVEDSWERFDD